MAMKITAISQAVRNPNRVNISIDGAYRFSLDIFQLSGLGIKVGTEFSEEELATVLEESQFGKLYTRTLEYCLMRPHSAREVRDYLYRKMRTTKYKTRSGEVKEREGVSQSVADRVFERLVEKGYIDDEKFARFWVESRHQVKGASRRKLQSELQTKGVASSVIERALGDSGRTDDEELVKVIAKKRKRYPDEQKLIAYLARQGFRFDDIKRQLSEDRF